ncbi:hypothetical protein P167DRAFT_399597 [Morchella conica CCBAS932]|uniref:Uncharacterized protein n=1 Tax=Morchella conica CCBAS932 TaxID=1392247 RepID=A0A3N4KAJ8_9PEZI|nr:hypothetical protein P167DRAFT_399597 [Morchella conica CCBAS932]
MRRHSTTALETLDFIAADYVLSERWSLDRRGIVDSMCACVAEQMAAMPVRIGTSGKRAKSCVVLVLLPVLVLDSVHNRCIRGHLLHHNQGINSHGSHSHCHYEISVPSAMLD